ncbi:hypothetical protein [Photobacterium leiognathi]|uniref:hypothetical protein n=1 Tax=Photobacterium leiognathi TaxID=553611 RepID=UPI00076ADF77|nr:hypothetical protein [Photobacterium leiognathi]
MKKFILAIFLSLCSSSISAKDIPKEMPKVTTTSIPQNDSHTLATENKLLVVSNTEETLHKHEKLLAEIIKNQNQINKNIKEKTSNDNNLSTWTSILLACVAIIVTVLGVIIAFISFFGFNNLKKTTLQIAEETSKEHATSTATSQVKSVATNEIKSLIDNGVFDSIISQKIDLVLRTRNTSENYSNFDELDLDNEGNNQ